MESLIVISGLLFLVALVYAMVGHGGASGYLTVMALFGVVPLVMKPSALVLNLFVSGIAFFLFYKAGFFRWRLILPFVLTSIPAAFIGGSMNLEVDIYRKMLGVALVLSVVGKFVIESPKTDQVAGKINWYIALFSGLLIGLVSGMIGIGGGIILSPLLLLLGWANVKEAACASAIFIFINSSAGLLGYTFSGASLDNMIWIWVLAALLGGTLGAYIGSRRMSMKGVEYALAFVLSIAAVKLIFF
jgi:uncharacterized protein